MPACLAIEVRGFFALFGPSGGKIAVCIYLYLQEIISDQNTTYQPRGVLLKKRNYKTLAPGIYEILYMYIGTKLKSNCTQIFMGCSLFGMTAFFLLFSLVYRLAVIQYRYPRLAEHLADWKSLLAGAAFASALLVVFCRITNDIIITPEVLRRKR
jgi:hypothetical protein